MIHKRIVLIDAPPGRSEKITSACLIVATLAAFAIMAPAARMPLQKINAFIPAYEAALCISDLLTAVLLFGQFARSGLKALLVLACAYLFNVLVIVPHALSFLGVFPLELVARSFLADRYPGGQKKSRPSEKRAAF